MADIIVDGRTRVDYVPTIASATMAPTVIEYNAGKRLDKLMTAGGLEGFEVTTEEIDATSFSSVFAERLPGRQSVSGTGLVIKKQDGTDTVYATLSVPNTSGYLVVRDDVPVDTAVAAAQKVDVWPIRTAAANKVGRGEANSVLRYRVPVTVTATPKLDLAVLA